MTVSIDIEATGLDTHHGAAPYFVTACDPDGKQTWWEWPVDPLTRRPAIPRGEPAEVESLIASAPRLALQNAKYDIGILARLGIPKGGWPWEKTEDTLYAGHLLASNQPHNLTDMALSWLGLDIEPLEKSLEQAVKKCRSMIQQARLKDRRQQGKTTSMFSPEEADPIAAWRIAEEGLPEMPSVHGGGSGKNRDPHWKADGWLPRAMAHHLWGTGDRDFRPPEDVGKDAHPWYFVLRDYANGDSFATIQLWQVMEVELKSRGLLAIYRFSLQRARLALKLEQHGATANVNRVDQLEQEYREESEEAGEVCRGIATSLDYDLDMPKGGNNQSLREFCFGQKLQGDTPLNPIRRQWLGLPPLRRSDKTGEPSLDKAAMEQYEATLPAGSKALAFVKTLRSKRRLDTSLQYLAGYRRFWLPQDGSEWVVMHGNANPCGTDTLRWSFSNPNCSNFCFDGETELLTKNGWVSANQLSGNEQIAQYWKDTGRIDFTDYELLTPTFRGDMLHITTEQQQIDMLLTPKHRCLLRSRQTMEKVDLMAWQFRPDHHHLHAGWYVGGNVSLPEHVVAWICSVQADGSYHRVQEYDCGIRFVFTKKRKANRLRWILTQLGAKYTEKTNSKQQADFYIHAHDPAVEYVRQLMPKKTFGSWILDLDRETLNLFIDEVPFWDGTTTQGRCEYTSSIKSNTDWVQIAFTLSNNRARQVTYLAQSGNLHHRISVAKGRDYSLTTNFNCNKVNWNGTVYCASVPSSYILVRRNGVTSITGNSKQEIGGHSLRFILGPAPGREWWSLDAQNIERRIPAYEAGEEEVIALLERPDDPPYFGSEHALVAHLLHPREFEACKNDKGDVDGGIFKSRYKTTLYQWVKNGNFAVQYGCQEAKADTTYRVRGAYQRIKQKFARQDALNRHWIHFAEKRGYVETIPDRGVNPKRGYPLMCARTEWGRILPTIPLAYHVSGTAMWWTAKAMLAADAQLAEWNRQDGFDGFVTLQVHDELVFDFPRSKVLPRQEMKVNDGGFLPNGERARSNLWRIRKVRGRMAACGDDLGIPTPVGISYNAEHWGQEEAF
mgnify:CR=1 FL=1